MKETSVSEMLLSKDKVTLLKKEFIAEME